MPEEVVGTFVMPKVQSWLCDSSKFQIISHTVIYKTDSYSRSKPDNTTIVETFINLTWKISEQESDRKIQEIEQSMEEYRKLDYGYEKRETGEKVLGILPHTMDVNFFSCQASNLRR